MKTKKPFAAMRSMLANWAWGQRGYLRRDVRYDCNIPVEVHLDSPGHLSIFSAVACNISSGGMLIKCPTLPDSMAPCHVSFTVPDWFPFPRTDRNAMAYAHVRHTNPMHSTFGVAFSSPLIN
jgi:hypothetical protein